MIAVFSVAKAFLFGSVWSKIGSFIKEYRKELIGIFGFFLLFWLAYNTGYERATARYQLEAATTQQKIKDAIQQASQTLSGVTNSIATADRVDAKRVQEILDDAQGLDIGCSIPVGSLRKLDDIGR